VVECESMNLFIMCHLHQQTAMMMLLANYSRNWLDNLYISIRWRII